MENQDKGDEKAISNVATEGIAETKTPKKRGRKRKSEQVKTVIGNKQTVEAISEKTEDKVEARSLRKRKSVDYFALVHPDVSTNDNTQSPTETKKIKNKRPKNSDVMKSESNCDVDDVAFQEDSTLSESTDLEANDEQKTESAASTKSNKEKSDKPDVSWGKVYRRTGTTREMVNTLFSQVEFQHFDESTKDAEESSIGRTLPSRNLKEESFEGKNMVTCAVCKKEVDKHKWTYHKQRFHNNLTWRVGDKPLDLSNMDLVKQILNALYATKKPFYCEKCDKAMKSVNGFLSHKSTCGRDSEDVKIVCKLCNRKMLPVSLPSHIRLIHENKKTPNPVLKTEDDEHDGSRRRAAKKALEVIQNLSIDSKEENAHRKHFMSLKFFTSKNALSVLKKQLLASKKITCKYPCCESESSTLEDVLEHLNSCVNKPENGHVCKYCLFVSLTEEDMVSHIENLHEIEFDPEPASDSDEARDSDIDKRRKLKKKQQILERRLPFFIPYCNKKLDKIFEKSYEWTLELCHKNLSTPITDKNLSFLKSNWELMPLDSVEEYLPQIGYSCDVGFETVTGFQNVLKKDHSFRKFHLFESYLENNGNSTVFCGGPITALSWVPVPFDRNGFHQVVAVATKKHPDAKYMNDENYNEKCVIQFWDVGPLRILETSMYRPRLGFCLSFDHGPIWDLKWCPSNCYDLIQPPGDEYRRLGLLAVAGSDSAVHIYSIPNLKACGEFYNSRPVLKLVPMAVQEMTLGNKPFYATKISWTKASGHKYIAVGYSNGMVSIYNIANNSKLLLRNGEDVNTLLPFKSFQAHLHCITGICLHHLNNGCRWLLTSSYDRAVSLWDLNETSAPIQHVRKNIVNDILWLSNWLCFLIAYDEASTLGLSCTAVHQVRDFLSDPFNMFYSSAAVTCLTGSDWLNSVIQANAVGEIFAAFPKQLLVNLNGKGAKTKRFLLGFTTLVEKDKTVEERVKENSEKEKALKNQLKIKTVIKQEELPKNKEVTHLDYNPHYYEYEPMVYNEVDSKYGLLFCDHKMNSYSDFPAEMQDLSFSSKLFGSSKPNIYPLQCINKIELNPNRQATTYYVAGYQAGFARFTCMKFLNKDPQLIADDKLLNK